MGIVLICLQRLPSHVCSSAYDLYDMGPSLLLSAFCNLSCECCFSYDKISDAKITVFFFFLAGIDLMYVHLEP